MKHLLKITILTSLLLTQPACGLFGTETGNPVQSGTETEGDDGSVNIGSPSETSILLSTLCEAIKNCVDSAEFDSSDCADMMNTDSGALSAFGANGYESFDDVQKDIIDGNISINDTIYNNCLDTIDSQSCATMGSSSVYVVGSADYTNVDTAIPSECGNIF